MELLKGFTGLLQSRKALIVVAITTATLAFYTLGWITWDQAKGLIQIVIPSWLGAHAWEQGKLLQAKAVADKLKDVAKTTYVGVPTEALPPPTGPRDTGDGSDILKG